MRNFSSGTGKDRWLRGSPYVAYWMLCVVFIALPSPQAGAQQAVSANDSRMSTAGREDQIIDMILVRVNGQAILWSDLRQQERDRVALIEDQVPREQLLQLIPALRRNLLVGLIDEQVILQRAELLEIQITSVDIERAVENLKNSQGLSAEGLEDLLVTEGLTLAELREQLRKTLLQQRLIQEEVTRQIFVSDQEIRDHYDEHQDGFSEPERLSIQQIVFFLEGKNPARIEEQAQIALAELRAGSTLEAVSSKHIDAQVIGGSDPTPVAVSDLLPEIAAAAATLQPGEYSEPTKTAYAIHIVKLRDRDQPSVQDLAEVENEIRQRLMQDKYEDRFQEYVQELRENTHIQIFAAQFQDITDEWSVGEMDLREGS